MNKLNWIPFVLGLLLGAVAAAFVGSALMQRERREHAAAIRDLLDCAVTTGWAQAPGPNGDMVWLPLSE